MHVALIHNPDAGEGVYEKRDLERLFLDAGHEVDAFGERRAAIERAVASGADVLVVAGGDGSVAKTAIALHRHGSKLPLFILPVGTANNIARSLGIDAATPVLIKSLAAAQPVPLDIGRATGRWGTTAFVEAAGVGFFGTMLHSEHSLRTKVERFLRNLRPASRNEFQMAALGLARIVRRQRARYHDVRVDGENLSGEYLAVEALNISAIGPRVVLAPHANSGDRMLDLLLIQPEHRDAVAGHIEAMGAPGSLPASWYRRVARAEVSWAPRIGHVDDEPWPDGRGNESPEDVAGTVTLDVQGGIHVLIPAYRTSR